MKRSTAVVLSVIAASVAGLLIIAGLLLMWFVGVRNHAVALREGYNAKEKTVQTAHDNMWKTISQKHQVAGEYKDGFIKTIEAAVEGRKGGALFKSVTENMPGLPDSLYREVLATIEGRRDMLKRELDTEVDLAREYNTLIGQFPGSLFVGGPRIEPRLITSDDTKQAWESGSDNNVKLGK